MWIGISIYFIYHCISSFNLSIDYHNLKVPKHGAIPESTHLNFYDQNLSVVIQENVCVIRHPEPIEKMESHMATTIGKNDEQSYLQELYRYIV